MNNMLKVQALQKCADRHRYVHDARQKVEYKVLITALTFYVGATWAIGKHDVDMQEWAKIGVTLAFFALAVVTSFLLKRLHFSNRVNISISENCEAEIINLLQLSRNPIPEKFQKRDYDNPRHIQPFPSNCVWQCTAVWCFAVVAALLIWTQ